MINIILGILIYFIGFGVFCYFDEEHAVPIGIIWPLWLLTLIICLPFITIIGICQCLKGNKNDSKT